MKKKIICLLAAVFAVGIFAAGAFLLRGKFDLKIHGREISKEEYLYVMNQQIYSVSNELTEGTDIQIDRSFWDTERDGIVPYKRLADATVEKLKYYRAVYETAVEQGYVDYPDYEHMLKRMEAENDARAAKIEKGDAVYGLSRFSAELFMEYEMDSFQKKYCENLENEGMQITDEERRQYYEEHKDALFQKNDDLTLDYVKIPYMEEGADEARKDTLFKELTAVYKKMDASHTLGEIVSGNELLKPYLYHEELLSGEVSAKAKAMGDVLELGYELDPGEPTQVADENGVLYLIQCTEKTDYDYLPMEEVKDNITKELREQSYNAIIEKKSLDLEVSGDMEYVYALTLKYIKK